MSGDQSTDYTGDAIFTRRVIIVLGLIGFSALLLYLSDLILLIVASILVAVVLRAVARLICHVIPMKEHHAVLPAALIILGVLGVVVWLFGAEMATQTSLLIDMLPGAWENLKSLALTYPLGAQLVAQVQHIGQFAGNFASQVPLIALGVAGAIANLGLAIVGGLMLAMEGRSYREGALMLFPRSVRINLRKALNSTALALRAWLLAQAISMVVIGVLTGIGLWLAGVPSALGLGLFAGLAQFVPVVGPIASAIPGLMIAATTDWTTFLWALAIYVGVQQIEGNLVTPWVQKHIAGIPMALSLFAIVAFGILFGPLGIILATPLTMIVLVMVRSLYIRDLLGEEVELPGEEKKTDTPRPVTAADAMAIAQAAEAAERKQAEAKQAATPMPSSS
jgi:predicted PurR-regulated permease PerM